MSDTFWSAINAQLTELCSAKTADDVVRILSAERNPYGYDTIAADGFFGGSGGDGTVMESLQQAGWRVRWSEASYHWSMQAPCGDTITYVDGDIYRGDRRVNRSEADAQRYTTITVVVEESKCAELRRRIVADSSSMFVTFDAGITALAYERGADPSNLRRIGRVCKGCAERNGWQDDKKARAALPLPKGVDPQQGASVTELDAIDTVHDAALALNATGNSQLAWDNDSESPMALVYRAVDAALIRLPGVTIEDARIIREASCNNGESISWNYNKWRTCEIGFDE